MLNRKSKGNVLVTERDLKILRHLFEHKVVSRKQIGSCFFGNAVKTTVNIRLAKLLRLGLLKRRFIENESKNAFGYSITQKGLSLIKSSLPYQVKTQIIQSDSTHHDVALVDIRKAFESKKSVKTYYTENILQTSPNLKADDSFQPFIKLNSDGLALVSTKVGILKLAIEFDSYPKSDRRYRKKLDDYYWESEVNGVLYICADKYTLRSLCKLDREVAKSHSCDFKVFFALLEDVVSPNKEMTFHNADMRIFKVS